MPNIKLVGFSQEKADELIPRIAEGIREKTDLADKAVITYYPSTCVSAADTTKQMPYFCICNTGEGGTDEEFKLLMEILKPFGYDIEWGDINKFFPTSDF